VRTHILPRSDRDCLDLPPCPDQDHDEPCREAVSAEEHQDHQEGGGGREWGREWGEEEEEEKDKEGEEEEEEDPHVELLSPAEKAGFINTSGTVVTAYFHIPSKHPHASYKRWIVNFMSLQDAMVIFTSHDLVSEIKVLREHASERTLVIPMDLSATRMATSYDDAFWTHQSAMDPEREIHRSHELFWIWNEKAEWLQRAVNINPFGTLFFAWIDIGYFRDETFNDERILRAIPFSLGREQVLMLDVRDLAESSKNYVGGGFIGGYAGGIRKWHRAYYSVLDLNRDQFIGKDQPWMWRTCEVNPGLCMLVGPDLSRDHGDPWFYMAPFLAGRASDSDVFTVYPNASNYGSDDRFRDTIQVLSVWSGGCSMPVLSGVGKVGGAGVRLFCGSDECVESVSAEQPQWKVERLTLESMCGGTRLAGVLKRSEVHAKLAYGEDYGEIVNLVMRVCLMRRMQQSQAASPYSGKHFLFVDALHLDGAAGLLVAAPMVYENGRGLFLQCEGPATDDYTRGMFLVPFYLLAVSCLSIAFFLAC
jgi:hypothetical protein